MTLNKIYLFALIFFTGCYSVEKEIKMNKPEPFEEKAFLDKEIDVASKTYYLCNNLSSLIDIYLDSLKSQEETIEKISKRKQKLNYFDTQISLSLKNYKDKNKIKFLNSLRHKIKLVLIDTEKMKESVNDKIVLQKISNRINKLKYQIRDETNELISSFDVTSEEQIEESMMVQQSSDFSVGFSGVKTPFFEKACSAHLKKCWRVYFE